MTDSDVQKRLDALRRSIDLRVDSQGDWWEGDQRFSHPGVIAALNRGLGLHPETGESVVRIASQWCYVACDVTPFVVLRLERVGQTLSAHLNTGDLWPVDSSGFILQGDTLFMAGIDGHRARLSRAAQSGLAEYLENHGDGYCVRMGATVWPIRLESVAEDIPIKGS